ncbi:hypothetical protein [Pseudomonas sp. FEN]|uniref:hypothetical protein n=1 Tax=Pseudomonas sp. FEN TaxID=2767468 RepID=UPI001748286B|nr:hypothetical protein [Pseudomonas sp. FEN]
MSKVRVIEARIFFKMTHYRSKKTGSQWIAFFSDRLACSGLTLWSHGAGRQDQVFENAKKGCQLAALFAETVPFFNETVSDLDVISLLPDQSQLNAPPV